MATKTNMDWSIWGKKVGKEVVIIFIAGLASVYGNNPYYLALVPVIKAIENYLKHR